MIARVKQPIPDDAAAKKLPYRVTFVAMISGAIVIALLLVLLSMYLYNRSGAAQLDLSLPGLQEQRMKAQKTERFESFSASGPLNEDALDQFNQIYTGQQSAILQDKDGFDPDELNDEPLNISAEK